MEKLENGTHFTADNAQVYINGYNEETSEYHVVRGIRFGQQHIENAWLTREEIDERYGPLTHINNLKKP